MSLGTTDCAVPPHRSRRRGRLVVLWVTVGLVGLAGLTTAGLYAGDRRHFTRRPAAPGRRCCTGWPRSFRRSAPTPKRDASPCR